MKLANNGRNLSGKVTCIHRYEQCECVKNRYEASPQSRSRDKTTASSKQHVLGRWLVTFNEEGTIAVD